MSAFKNKTTTRYAELQVTTNFSFLRGASHAEELVAQAHALGLSALAVTDRNTLAGVVRAHLAAKELGLKLIVGARLDLQDAPSLLCLPRDRQAYGRLSRLLSLGQMRAKKGACTLFLDDVARHAEGQIFLALPPDDWDWRMLTPAAAEVSSTAAILPFRNTKISSSSRVRHAESVPSARREGGGEGPKLAPKQEVAPHPNPLPMQKGMGRGDVTFEAELRRVKQVLGDGAQLYLAASYTYRGDDRARIAALGALAERCGTPLVATGDVLYHAPHRRPLQDVLSCVREKTTIREAGLELEANAERHLKWPMEMTRLFRGHEDAIARTLQIAEACRFSLDELVYEYPDEPTPSGKTPQQHLEQLSWEGARWRFPDGIPDKVHALIARELQLIDQLNYAPYFLTVHDIVRFARSKGILCQGRGSAANSAVCYCLAITAVNPTEIDVLFERFVSPERREPPDIDVDFEHERREEVIQYIYARYGRNRAGLAATVISYRARSAVRDVGKAMGLSEDTVAALAGMVWGTTSGGELPEKHVRAAGLDPKDPLLATVLELAHELMGFPRHLSQHVGGFVLTRGPLIEVVPVGNAAMEDRTFIEWDKDDIAALGLLKVDVLALGMLTCIRRAFDLIERHEGKAMTLASVPREDPAVYDMLCRADSIGVFQVESRAQMNMLPRLKPRCFYDLVIEVAIVRPGPIQGDMVHPYLRRRDGVEPEHYPSPSPEHGPRDELKNILGKTKGVPLFQEQAMRIALIAAKFSDAEVNELRKAMATFRRRGTIGLLEEKMVSRMTARGYDAAFAQRCFNQIKGFGEYGFPESHAASFAHLVYVSSWIKCHHPAAFAAALLNSQPMGFYAPAQIVRDAREHAVEVREADVNLSDWDCTLEAGGADGRPALRLGLRQIDGLQEEEIKKLVAVRGASLSPSFLQRWGEGQGEGQSLAPAQVVAPHPGPLVVPKARFQRDASGERGKFRDVHDLWARGRLRLATLEKLAAADAFRSVQAELGFAKTGLDRRQALWEVKALAAAEPLPLFSWSETREAAAEPFVQLPEMRLSEHVVSDYQTLRLSLKAHPMSFLRERFKARRVLACDELRSIKDGAWVAVAGVVLVRQRPGSAKGVVFMTIEDETGIANAVVWAKTLERFRKEVMGARLIVIHGRVQRHEDIIHVVAARLEDRSDWLQLLSAEGAAIKAPVANADHVRHQDTRAAPQGQHSGHPRWAGHPRNERIIPKSRDFH
ncbi:MAG: error-prone DNA polymerase [Hyphomicrobium sp.]|uniref:error-prone DNA polymerase n=1 Tax=Hyphomicrobium sp. TaxID=82 RepID=UPI00132547C2|nr:error-prone DNA polymerase [Hyphomicrobium sp.]KAB2942502.1 MAG: error-prone DNA polymerase [Hyphomicrobium sp.]MBZ0208468.1 error-prone DNA polymerase [Hyphomicrobium sp.]